MSEMALFQTLLCLPFFLFQILSSQCSSTSTSCNSQEFTKNRFYQFCNDLPHLKAHVHWSYDPASFSLSLAFVAPPAKPDGWISWGVNPSGSGMIGTQAVVAFKKPGDGSVTVKTYRLNSYKSIEEGEIEYKVSRLEGESHGGLIMIFANMNLPMGITSLNQVWQVGSSVINGTFPAIHAIQPENLSSKSKLDLVKGHSSSVSRENSKLISRDIHGALNVVSWGILFPIGIMIARYMKTFSDPVWFYVHVACQTSSYVVGVAGWATGMKLGSQSKGVEYTSHRDLGITLFCLATLQMFALFLRPKRDHKYRLYWNIYHHGVGYGVLVVGIVNVFKGLEILEATGKWRIAYIIFLAVLGGIAVPLEVTTWIAIRRRKPMKSTILYDAKNGSIDIQHPTAS